jgi:hypothetical protein
VDAEKLIGQ